MIKKLTIFVCILFWPLAVSADVLVFKSGKTVEGLITKVTDTGITFQSRGDILGVSYTQIKDIHESSGNNASNSQYIAMAKGGVTPLASQAGTSSRKKVDVYMTSWCPYCQKMIKFLNENGIVYTAYDIEKNEIAHQNYSKYGGHGVPLIVVGETVIRGYDPDRVVEALR